MRLRRLSLTNLRNIQSAGLSNLATINILYGDNGSGKTTVLEGIYMLSLARSFRSHKIKPLINKEADSCVVFSDLDADGGRSHSIGIERQRTTGGQIKLDGKPAERISQLAELLPLQLINSDSFQLLTGGPVNRRRFLDWGVFHVEHHFHEAWKITQRCLKQRNSLLRHGRMDGSELAVWDQELARAGAAVTRYRRQYIEAFTPLFAQMLTALTELDPMDNLELGFSQGWDKSTASLAEYLQQQSARDRELGHTHGGPHRADLRLRYKKESAGDVLSRGQQKLVVCALSLAQAVYLQQQTDRRCVFLIDDLPAELDAQHRQTLCKLLVSLGSQVFISCVDPADLEGCWPEDTDIAMFHVEHGRIHKQ